MAKTSFLKLVIVVIWSVTPIFHVFLFVFLLKKSLVFVLKEILITQTQHKPKKSRKQKHECAFSHKNNV